MVLTQPGHLEKGFRGKCHPREQSLKASVGVSRRAKGALGEPPAGQRVGAGDTCVKMVGVEPGERQQAQPQESCFSLGKPGGA